MLRRSGFFKAPSWCVDYYYHRIFESCTQGDCITNGKNNSVEQVSAARTETVRRCTREFGIFATFSALTVLMTWPWILHLRDAVGDKGDTYLGAWILWWDYHQTFTSPFHLFDANILFPYRYTLAFSEHCYGISVLFFPLFALGLRPLTVNGIATLTGFALCGYGAFRLTRTLTGSNGAAWIAGIMFAFVPFRFHHLPHLVYLFSGWIPLLLEALVLYVRRPSRRRAVWLGVAFLMNALTCIHWFVLSLVPLMLTALFLMWQNNRWRDRSFWIRATAALGAASLALLPFMIPYLRVASLYGLVRNSAEATFFSAHAKSWLTVDWQNKMWQGMGAQGYTTELALFPGVVPLLLALVAILPLVRAGWRRLKSGREQSKPESTGYRDAIAIGLIWMILGFVGSFGMNFVFHRTLFKYISLFKSIRVPARWSMICFVGLSVLAGIGAAKLLAQFSFMQRRRWQAAGFVLIAGLMLWEQREAPLVLFHGDVDPNAVTLRLKATPMNGGIVELPAGVGNSNYLYILRAADHGKPLVNGVSGFSAPIVTAVEELSNSRPVSPQFLDLLEAIPVSYLVVHHRALPEENRAATEKFLNDGIASGRIRLVQRFDDQADDLFVITKTEPEAAGKLIAPK